MDSPAEIGGIWQRRMDAYQKEIEVLSGKLDKADVPPGKKEKLDFRLRDIQNRLLPGAVCKMQNAS